MRKKPSNQTWIAYSSCPSCPCGPTFTPQRSPGANDQLIVAITLDQHTFPLKNETQFNNKEGRNSNESAHISIRHRKVV